MEVDIQLNKVLGWCAWQQITKVSQKGEGVSCERTAEVLLLKDFGMFGELEFETFDWRH